MFLINRSLNVRCIGMTETTGLKHVIRGRLQWHHMPTKFHENPPDSKHVPCTTTEPLSLTVGIISFQRMSAYATAHYAV
jgi:hypothetical protein